MFSKTKLSVKQNAALKFMIVCVALTFGSAEVVGALQFLSTVIIRKIKGLLHGYEWGLRFGGLELRFG